MEAWRKRFLSQVDHGDLHQRSDSTVPQPFLATRYLRLGTLHASILGSPKALLRAGTASQRAEIQAWAGVMAHPDCSRRPNYYLHTAVVKTWAASGVCNTRGRARAVHTLGRARPTQIMLHHYVIPVDWVRSLLPRFPFVPITLGC